MHNSSRLINQEVQHVAKDDDRSGTPQPFRRMGVRLLRDLMTSVDSTHTGQYGRENITDINGQTTATSDGYRKQYAYNILSFSVCTIAHA